MSTSLTLTFTVDRTPQGAFDAITDVRAWWSGPPAPTQPQIEGRTDRVGEEFTYLVAGLHFTRFRIVELVPHRRVAWLTLDSELTFVADRQEWTGTTVTFDVTEHDGRTQVVFTHVGLVPEHECYDVCDDAWSAYVLGNLRSLIETGAVAPAPAGYLTATDAVP